MDDVRWWLALGVLSLSGCDLLLDLSRDEPVIDSDRRRRGLDDLRRDVRERVRSGPDRSDGLHVEHHDRHLDG